MLRDHKAYDGCIDKLAVVRLQEQHFQRRMEQIHAEGLLKRRTVHGQMDIHTASHIYEIKHWSDYKHALGQLLAYNVKVRKDLAVVFFGTRPDGELYNEIFELFNQFNICVMYFDQDDNIAII